MREQVRTFAEAMEEVLKKNDYKGGWGTSICTETYLRARLVEEMGEYFRLVVRDNASGKVAQKELIDIANFCMMLWTRTDR